MSPRDKAVLLIGFGGPASADEVRPFLREVTRGRGIPSARIDDVAHHYERVGGRSPYNEIAARQAAALCQALGRDGSETAVYVGMRNCAPRLRDALGQMARDGVRQAAGVVLAPHRSQASFERYTQSVGEAQAALGARAPAVDYVAPWHNHPLFIEAVAAQVRRAMAKLSSAERAGAHLLFTAHSIPRAMAQRSAYVEELEESASMAASALEHRGWSVAYQSRSGEPEEPWLEPALTDVIPSLKGSCVILVPIGFVCENVELLYDLDIEAAELARTRKVAMVRARAVNDDPRFIAMMADVVRARLEASEKR